MHKLLEEHLIIKMKSLKTKNFCLFFQNNKINFLRKSSMIKCQFNYLL